jgi:hypothetical protein
VGLLSHRDWSLYDMSIQPGFKSHISKMDQKMVRLFFFFMDGRTISTVIQM